MEGGEGGIDIFWKVLHIGNFTLQWILICLFRTLYNSGLKYEIMPIGNLGCCFWIIHNGYEPVPFHFECIISAGFRWLLAEISKDHANLSRRVEKDSAEQVNTL